MPLVSIIIPNYNHAPYLRERIDSVLQQRFQDFELILLDDSSSDNSREILEAYRNHPKVSHLVFNETNSGSTFIQWKKGIELAQGEWIWIAESDDLCEALFLEKMLEAVAKEASDFVYCNSRIIDEHGMSAEWFGFVDLPSKKHFPQFEQSFSMPGTDFMNAWMVTYNFIPNASAVLFKKALIQNAHFSRLAGFKLLGDWYFWNLLLLSTPRIVYLAEPLNLFRTHSNNVRSKRITNQITEFPEIIAQFARKDLRTKAVDAYMYRYVHKPEDLALSVGQRFKVHRTVLKYGKYLTFVKALLKKRWSNA